MLSLRVQTRLTDAGDLLQYASRHLPHLAVWLRRGDGIVGRGEAFRAEFRGAHRIAEARERWDALVAAAEIRDEVRVRGSGLVAFGAFAFDAASAAASVLRVPEVVVGRSGDAAFVTHITPRSGPAPAAVLPEPDPIGEFAPLEFRPGAMSRERHRAAVRDAVARIHAGELAKVVLARDLVAPRDPSSDLREVVRRLAAAYPDTWTYAIDGLIGASPEMLVRVRDGAVTARVLAGTAPRSDDPTADAAAAEALRTSAKNLAEHRYAVDSALQSLGALDCHDDPDAGITASPEPFVLELPNVWHLASDIRGTLPPDASVLELVHSLHPTAAVGGTPRDAALAAIAQLEPFDRRRFAGPAGWLSANGDGEWVVAIRGAEFTDRDVTAIAGGGIVAASDPEEEFAETLPKFRPLLEACGASPAAVPD